MLLREPFPCGSRSADAAGRRCCAAPSHLALSFLTRYGFLHPVTRILEKLLGPCFKTGQLKPCCDRIARRLVVASLRPLPGLGLPPHFCVSDAGTYRRVYSRGDEGPHSVPRTQKPRKVRSSTERRQPLTNCPTPGSQQLTRNIGST